MLFIYFYVLCFFFLQMVAPFDIFIRIWVLALHPSFILTSYVVFVPGILMLV